MAERPRERYCVALTIQLEGSDTFPIFKKKYKFDGVLFFIKRLFANCFWMGQWIQNTNSSEPYCEGTQ